MIQVLALGVNSSDLFSHAEQSERSRNTFGIASEQRAYGLLETFLKKLSAGDALEGSRSLAPLRDLHLNRLRLDQMLQDSKI